MDVREEQAVFGAFYKRTCPRAFGIAYGVAGERGLAEDAPKDAYVAVCRERRRYHGEGPVEAWLYRIVVDAAVSAIRGRWVRLVVALDPAADRGPLSAVTATTLDGGPRRRPTGGSGQRSPAVWRDPCRNGQQR